MFQDEFKNRKGLRYDQEERVKDAVWVVNYKTNENTHIGGAENRSTILVTLLNSRLDNLAELENDMIQTKTINPETKKQGKILLTQYHLILNFYWVNIP